MFNQPPFAAITSAMIADVDHGCASIGWNLFHDERINDRRSKVFATEIAAKGLTITDAATMEDGLIRYFNNRVRFTRTPDFLDPAINEDNFHNRRGPLPALHGSKLLVRVFNLGLLDRIFLEAKSAGISAFVSYGKIDPTTRRARTVIEWLDQQLSGLPAAAGVTTDLHKLGSHKFIRALLDFLNSYRRANPFQPSWATVWERLSEGDWENPHRWMSVLGVQPASSPTWLLLLRYPVREVGQLVRPTQLEAGWYPEHFPSPPVAKLGHPMDLDAGRPVRSLLPEYIHQQIDHLPDHVVACARIGPPASVDVPRAQQRHCRVLKKVYPSSRSWMRPPHPCVRF